MSMKLNVLHVEDDRVDAMALTDLLGKGGFAQIKLSRAATMAKAKAMLKEEDFDLILLDLGLPEESGIDALLTIRCAAPGTPVVVLTGHDDLATAQEAVSNGAEDFSVKGRDSANELARKLACARERHYNRFVMHARMAEMSEENSHLERLANHDPLTGLLNRRGLDVRLRGFEKTGRPGYAILVDVDDFKAINDELGHQAGDQVLNGVAARIASVKEGGLAAARIGGDEFLLVGLGDKQCALDKAEALHQALTRSMVVRSQGSKRGVTCCQALVAFESLTGASIADFLKGAHEALTKAKASGKDRIVQSWGTGLQGAAA